MNINFHIRMSLDVHLRIVYAFLLATPVRVWLFMAGKLFFVCFFSFLKNNIFKNVRIIFCIVFACVHVCAVPLEAKKCHLVPWNCSYREPVGQTLVLCQNSQSP